MANHIGMGTRWGAGLVAVAVLALGFGPAPPAGAVERTVTHHLTMEGVATPTGSQGGTDLFAGRALQDDGYNRNVVYRGTTSSEYFFTCHWSSGTFTLVDRDGSTLTVQITEDWWTGSCYNLVSQRRTQDVLVTEGTGRFVGVTGTGHVDLTGLPVQLEGDLVLTLCG